MEKEMLGYDGNLFVLPFDHRGSFESGLLGISGREPTQHERTTLTGYKQIIYDGMLEAIAKGAPLETSAVLVDQRYGTDILADANRRGLVTCVTVEKSGQVEFDFEYGDNFRQAIEDANPTFAKVLVRYNPEADERINANQRERLKVLSDYVHSAGYRFMFELLVPSTAKQLDSVGGDRRSYDSYVRPALMIKAMSELQEAGIEPDVWKLEGIEDVKDATNVVAVARSGGRDRVGLIMLGRGEDEQRVRQWIINGAQTEGFIGFAIGRTVFWQPLIDYRDERIIRADAVSRIANTYLGFRGLFIQTRNQAAAR